MARLRVESANWLDVGGTLSWTHAYAILTATTVVTVHILTGGARAALNRHNVPKLLARADS